ncbi:exonuclease SbcCD subunit D C-terminal domain-containing protein [Gynuella sunshinyii]|uniref:Nuclease SbcCD subunit D n=1 Tax=Gynuella sunshinyii YC6258 TaxID=1445510 RepID=A0A0C5VPC2_9GAMM|nr:exonuclease SbcCD subunit D C-terminal domain-containing protein [Gynuella sunshinyii]AJQ95233.1 DNA repair exonuclease [Gynuella sunshinyii YC6258]
MRILHTSDWHLGRSLYGRKRYDEFSAFLDWLMVIIEQEKINALLVAGDVFDTTTPSHRAQSLYYRFLCQVAASCCRHVVVIAGNHDSPSFLEAPRELLKILNVHVIGAVTESLEDEVLLLSDGQRPEAIVCAVPYLRDKDVRTAMPGETIDDKNRHLLDGIRKHYENVCALAVQKRASLEDTHVPIIAMGHLFTAGGTTMDGDGVRELYVGSLAHIEKSIFPSSIDYLALGHLHVPQKVGDEDHLRYSGSPIPMGFGEANQQKQVIVIEAKPNDLGIKEISVPCFQPLVRIVGARQDIVNRLQQLVEEHSNAWLEIEYTGQEVIGDLRAVVDEILSGSLMEVRRIKNRRMVDRIMQTVVEEEMLDDLNEGEVFVRCLDAHDIPEEQRPILTDCYQEIVQSLHDADKQAE